MANTVSFGYLYRNGGLVFVALIAGYLFIVGAFRKPGCCRMEACTNRITSRDMSKLQYRSTGTVCSQCLWSKWSDSLKTCQESLRHEASGPDNSIHGQKENARLQKHFRKIRGSKKKRKKMKRKKKKYKGKNKST